MCLSRLLHLIPLTAFLSLSDFTASHCTKT
uniref:Uncharacterized protein n=1 Tax=Anguilla anguilla TaxID=7936 RepID=A0A0E9P9I0_ANGAN